MRQTFFAVLILSLGLASCESATTVITSIDTSIVNTSDRALFVVNEGNYGDDNGSVDAIIMRSNPSVDTSFHANVVSAGLDLNDIHFFGHTAIILDAGGNDASGITHPGAIDLVDADSLKILSKITLPGQTPNKMAQIAPNEFLITQRYGSYALIFDAAAKVVSDSIYTGQNGAEIGVLGGKAFVTISGYKQPSGIASYDLTSKQLNTVIRSSFVYPEMLVVDSAHNQLIVGCYGDNSAKPVIGASIYFVDPATLAIKDSIVNLPSLSSLVLGDKLYAIGNDVRTVDLVSHVMGGAIISGKSYYKGVYDARDRQLYLGNAGDFTHNGSLDVYDVATGTLKWSRTAGIAPGHFAFYH